MSNKVEHRQEDQRGNLRIVVLEDDWQQAESIKKWLECEFPGAAVRIIDTAKNFQRLLPDFEAMPPDAFILDMMVRYTDPDDDELETEDVQKDFFTAGARCHEEIRNRGLGDRSLIYSVTDPDDLRIAKLGHLVDIHIQKLGDKSKLRDAIVKLTGRHSK